MRRVTLKRNTNITSKIIPKVISTGFFGGIIWGLISAFFGYFNFTSITPKSFIIRPFVQTEWSDKWLGQLISIFILCVLSIVVAFIYYVLFKKINKAYPGFLLGVVLWFICFWLLEPLFSTVPK